jgi:hypothetical protein
VIGEAIFDPDGFRKGSSLDERLLGQMLCETLFQQHGGEFPGAEHPYDIYCALVMQVSVILKYNEDAARRLMRKLAHQGTVSERLLAKILQQVCKAPIHDFIRAARRPIVTGLTVTREPPPIPYETGFAAAAALWNKEREAQARRPSEP